MSEKVTFRVERGDFVTLSMAVARRPLLFRISSVVATASLMVFAMSILPAQDPAYSAMLYDFLSGKTEWYPFYVFAVLVAVGLFFRHRLRGFNAYMGYARMPLADKDMTIELAADQIRVTAPEAAFDWTVPQLAVRALVETPTHLVVAVGSKEGVPVPRRAFASDAAWARFRDALVRFLPEGAAHDRA